MDSLTFSSYTFSLCQDDTSEGQFICVNPPLDGSESDQLELSIAKWKFIVKVKEAGEHISHCGGTNTCALCVGCHPCSDCIVMMRGGGEPGCNNTPFEKWRYDRSLENAKAELEFLESLRDE